MLKPVPFRALAAACLAVTAAAAADVPRPAPDFTINVPGGQAVQLSQYRGKVVVLAFILTTCPHCQKTVGILSTMQNEYGPRGLQVLASAIDSMAAMNLPDFMQRFKPTFPVGINTQEPVNNFLQHPVMIVMHMPQLVFIDRQGTIRAQYGGDDAFITNEEQQAQNIRNEIEALLKGGAPASKKHAAAKKGQ
jgi:peroxiredoxin